MLCDHLEGWDREGGRETQEGGDMGIYIYVELIHFVIKQKLTHHCKALYSNKDVKKKNSLCLPRPLESETWRVRLSHLHVNKSSK